MSNRIAIVSFSCAIIALLVALSPAPILAAANGEIRGTVVSAAENKPVPNAVVSLQGPIQDSKTTDQTGAFDFKGLPPGIYTLDVGKPGYASVSSSDIVLAADVVVTQRLEIAPTSFKSLGSVTIRARNSLQTSSQVYETAPAQVMKDQGIFRVSDYLRNLPGVNSFTTATPGDDVSLNLRGFANTETLALLNGHYFARNEDRYGMNYSDTPVMGLKSSQVIYGAGAVGFYGVDAIAGVVNLQTIDPTPSQETRLEIGGGTYSASILGLQTTGTVEKLGYAFAYGQNVTNGPIDHRLVYNAPYGNALGCTPQLITLGCGSYIVDQQTVRRSGVVTLRYSFDPTTTVAITGVTLHAWDDGSGNGANDWLLPKFAPPPPPLVSGAQGSGPVWLSTGINDGEVRFSKQAGRNLVVVDAFRSYFTAGRNYQFNIPPAWQTETGAINGLTISDQIFLDKHTIGFGYYTQGASDYFNGQPSSNPSYQPFSAYYVNSNVFLQDEWQPSRKLSVNGNLWFKRSQLVQGSHIDPRLAFIYRPSSNDVLRLSFSGGQTYPSAYIHAAQFNPIATVNFVCGPPLQAQIGIGPSSSAQAETSRDIELGYGHRFANGALIQGNLYDTILYNQLLGTNVTATSLGSNYLPPGYLAQLNAKNPCGGSLTTDNVVVNVFQNLGVARYHGLESNGSYPLRSNFFADWSYDIQLASPSAIDSKVYANSPGLMIGRQYFGVPMHKASLALRADNPHGVSGQLVAYFTSENNLNNLPGYVQVNGDVGTQFGPGRLSLGAVNILNKAPFDYGQQFIGISEFQQPGNPVVPTELFGLPHPSVFLKYDVRVH